MSERRCETKNRWRNVVVAFRMTPLQHILEILNKDEEKEDLDYGTDII